MDGEGTGFVREDEEPVNMEEQMCKSCKDTLMGDRVDGEGLFEGYCSDEESDQEDDGDEEEDCPAICLSDAEKRRLHKK